MNNTDNNYIIYKAQNTFTGEVYIGATRKSIEERKIDHIQKASNNIGSCFQEAIATYGAGAFLWEQIDTAENSNELAEKESNYIYDYKSKEEGYNSDRGGGIKKLVYQYDENGVLVGTFDGLKEVKKVLGLEKQRVSNSCINSTMHNGSFWSYKLFEKLIPKKDSRLKSVNQISLDGDLIACYESASGASRMTGISKTCITRCCRGERQQSGGFLWKYV